MKRFLPTLFFLLSLGLYAQVGIGTTNPDNSASLDITSTDSGLLIPRVSLVDVSNITTPVNSPATGLLVYNTNTSVSGGDGEGFYYFNGTIWVKFSITTGISTNLTDLGVITAFPGNTYPNDMYLALSGGTYNDADYPEFAAFITNLDSDAVTDNADGTFTLANWNNQGVFLRGQGGNAGSLGSVQNDATSRPTTSFTTNTSSTNTAGNHNHDFATANHDINSSASQGFPTGNNHRAFRTTDRVQRTEDNNAIRYAGNHTHIIPSLTVVGGGDIETRPINRSVTWVIKVKPSASSVNNLTINNITDIGTDDQNLTSATLTGTTLNLAIENGTGTSVNLAALQDGTGTDDQNLTSATLTGTTLNLAIENGTGTSVNLAALQDGTGTDDQNIQNLSFNNSTNILTVGIENGTAQTVNLSALDNTGNDWSINGNSGTNPTTNFIGTTDNQDLAFRTNNVEKVRITAKGQIETTQLESVWIGENAGNSVTSGTRNTFVGRISGASITTGNDNTAIGGLSLSTLSTGIDNTAVGLGALLDLQNGNGNTFVGEQSGENLVTGSYNTVLGHVAGENMNGSSNIFIGYQAGRSTTGSNKLIIDNSNDGTSSFIYGEMDNEILRANAEVQVTRNSTGTISHLDLIETGANDGSRLRFSNSAETTNNWLLYGRADNTNADSRLNIFYSGSGNIMEIYGDNTVELNGQFGVNLNNPTYAVHLPNNATIGIGQGRANAWTTYSDSRVKSNQQQLENGLALINKMIPKTYFHHNGNIEDGILNITDSGEQTLGFIAQELYEVLPEAVQKPEDENQSLWSVNYDKVIPVTVNAIQELNKKIEALETENNILKEKLSKLETLEARILALENSNSSNTSRNDEDNVAEN